MDTPLIETKYDFFSPEEYINVVKYCKNCPYYWGERDDYNTPFTGMVNNIYQRHDIMDDKITEITESVSDYSVYSIIVDNIERDYGEYVKDLTLARVVVNSFAPLENPYYHTDFDTGGAVTILVYMNENADLNFGGETQFLMPNNRIIGVLPVPNSSCCFDSTIQHKATAFKDQFRFTIAAKYTPL